MPGLGLIAVLGAGVVGAAVGRVLRRPVERARAQAGLVEALTATAYAAVAWALLAAPGAWVMPLATGIQLAAYFFFAAATVGLTLIDLDTHRLPDRFVLPCYPITAALITAWCLASGEWTALARAGVGAVALFGFYLMLRIVRRDGMGGGDVKLAGVVGAYLGWAGWTELALGAAAAFVLGGVVAVALLVTRRATVTTAIPFGPFMLAGAWIALLAVPMLQSLPD